MEMFTTPLSGSYTARTRNFDGSFNTFNVSCEVVGQTAKSYAIRLAFPIAGHKAKETINVRKHNVKLKEAIENAPVQQHDYSEAWWNK